MPCHPIDFKKTSCRHVDFEKVPCRMSLRPRRGHVAVSILGVPTPIDVKNKWVIFSPVTSSEGELLSICVFDLLFYGFCLVKHIIIYSGFRGGSFALFNAAEKILHGYFEFSIASCSSTQSWGRVLPLPLLLRSETRIPGVAPFSFRIGIWDVFVHRGQKSYTPTAFGKLWTTPGVRCIIHDSS